ncbi:MAG: hypothetical protein LH472_02125 [Pyrinomonadaceae bacterium]|nr:hypothetical protein [Pyrinomonadaceae bacterium]
MPFKYQVYKTQRVCLVRFQRSGTGEPVHYFPDIDNRGCFRPNTNGTGFDRGPVVGVTQGDDIYVRVLRERIANEAPLFVTSSDETVMTVNNGSKAELPKNYLITLRITGIQGNGTATPKGAKLRIHYGSEKGVVIGELSVWVFTKTNVLLTPHLITIQDATGASRTSSVDIGAVIGMAKAIWQPCGVTFTDAPVQPNTITSATAGVLAWQNDFNNLLANFWVPGSINAYFVFQINRPNPGVLGVGLSRQSVTASASTANPLPNPGIFLGDQSQNGIVRPNDTHWLANDLAHEIGHFLGLSHTDLRNGNNPRDDTWARRILMHPTNTRAANGNWRDDVGYGATYRGSLITMKDLLDTNNVGTNHFTDAEYLAARNTIKSTAGPY